MNIFTFLMFIICCSYILIPISIFKDKKDLDENDLDKEYLKRKYSKEYKKKERKR